MANNVNGLDEVKSTVALTLFSFINKIKSEIPNVKVVYDENLSYLTAKETFRANNNLPDLTNTDLYPLFAFKRSVLRWVEPAGPGRRMNSMSVRQDLTSAPTNRAGHSNVYKVVHGEFDLQFLYITKTASDLEKFEILYLSDEGISAYKEIDVDLTVENLGVFNYYADYQPLEDKSFEVDEVYYKMISGSTKIKGFYPILRGTSKHILSINVKFQEFLNVVLGDRTIVP